MPGFPLARLLREWPLNGIWEGSGSVTGLDALRALDRSPGCTDALLEELSPASGVNPAFDVAVLVRRGRARPGKVLRSGPGSATARAVASSTGRTLAASLLIRHAPPDVANPLLRDPARAGRDRAFGELPPGYPARAIVGAVTPPVG